MVKHLQFFEGNVFKIEGQIIAFRDVQPEFAHLKLSIPLKESY